MKLALLPEPRRIEYGRGTVPIPADGFIGITDRRLADAAAGISEHLPYLPVALSIPGQKDAIALTLDPALGDSRYQLSIGKRGIRLVAGSPKAACYGVLTLSQVFLQRDDRGRIPVVEIDDEPAFAARGVYYDIARGRVPRTEELLRQIQLLAGLKINEYQLYIEHTFLWRAHPDIGAEADGLDPEDILRIDDLCEALDIDLVPSLATFGHMGKILSLPRYHHLAEDYGVGKFTHPDPAWPHKLLGWTLSPANPEVYTFLDELFREFLPLFRSETFNICCDETWDLGWGQTHDLCEKRGKGRVYLDHILKVRELAAKYGKRIQMWGDIILKHPELIPELPSDVTVLDWGYSADRDMSSLDKFKAAGLPFYGCPGTSSWVTLFPRLPESRANIHNFAVAARAAGAHGLLNTDWGDGGHYNFMECSWYGYVFGAEQAWNPDADQSTFTARFARVLLGTDDPALVTAIDALGDIAQTQIAGYYQSAWRHAFFATPDDPIWGLEDPDGSVAENGRIKRGPVPWNAAFGRAARDRLQEIRKVLAGFADDFLVDQQEILPHWIFAVDTLEHAARKLAAFGRGGRASAATRGKLYRDMSDLRERFIDLWDAGNWPSEIEITLGYYDRALAGLEG